LISDALEYRVHVFTTGVVFAALVGQWVNVPLDRIAALFIVIAIVKTGWSLLSEGMRVLLNAPSRFRKARRHLPPAQRR